MSGSILASLLKQDARQTCATKQAYSRLRNTLEQYFGGTRWRSMLEIVALKQLYSRLRNTQWLRGPSTMKLHLLTACWNSGLTYSVALKRAFWSLIITWRYLWKKIYLKGKDMSYILKLGQYKRLSCLLHFFLGLFGLFGALSCLTLLWKLTYQSADCQIFSPGWLTTPTGIRPTTHLCSVQMWLSYLLD